MLPALHSSLYLILNPTQLPFSSILPNFHSLPSYPTSILFHPYPTSILFHPIQLPFSPILSNFHSLPSYPNHISLNPTPKILYNSHFLSACLTPSFFCKLQPNSLSLLLFFHSSPCPRPIPLFLLIITLFPSNLLLFLPPITLFPLNVPIPFLY